MDMKSSDLTICVAAYNEANVIGKTLQGLRSHFPEAELIVVDDGSTDGTASRAHAVGGVTVLSHSHNRGYGAALKTAMRHASGDAIAWFDGDGQHRPEDLKKVVARIMNGTKDAVIGVRVDGSCQQKDRLPGKMILKWVSELVAGERIPDLNSGLRCFRRDVVLRYLHLLPDGFSASTTTTLLMIKRGYRMGYEGVIAEKRDGQSSVRIIRDGLIVLQIILRTLVLFDALRFFILLAVVQIVPGLFYGLFMALRVEQGFPVLAAAVVISGVLTFFMGIVCDQITSIRKERFEDQRNPEN